MPPRFAILFAALLFGTTGTARALAGTGSTLSVGSARIVLGGALLAAVALSRGELRGLRRSLPLVVFASAGVAAYQLAFFAAVGMTGVSIGTVVTIGVAAVLTGGLERVVEGTGQGRRWLLATALAVSGVAILATTSGHGASVAPIGVALALLAALAYSTYAVVIKRMLRLGHSPGGAIGATFGGGALILLPALAVSRTAWLAEPRGAALVLYLGIFPTAIAYLLYVHGLRRISAGETATIGLAEPLLAALLGTVVLGEHLRTWSLVGGALVLAGLLSLTVRLPRVRLPEEVLSET